MSDQPTIDPGTDAGTPITIRYESDRSGGEVERDGVVRGVTDADYYHVETGEGSTLVVIGGDVYVRQDGSDYGNTRYVGTAVGVTLGEEA